MPARADALAGATFTDEYQCALEDRQTKSVLPPLTRCWTGLGRFDVVGSNRHLSLARQVARDSVVRIIHISLSHSLHLTHGTDVGKEQGGASGVH